jgi:hypothetical protein
MAALQAALLAHLVDTVPKCQQKFGPQGYPTQLTSSVRKGHRRRLGGAASHQRDSPRDGTSIERGNGTAAWRGFIDGDSIDLDSGLRSAREVYFS